MVAVDCLAASSRYLSGLMGLLVFQEISALKGLPDLFPLNLRIEGEVCSDPVGEKGKIEDFWMEHGHECSVLWEV